MEFVVPYNLIVTLNWKKMLSSLCAIASVFIRQSYHKSDMEVLLNNYSDSVLSYTYNSDGIKE